MLPRCDWFVTSTFMFQNVTVNSAIVLPLPYTTPKCGMTGLPVTSIGVLIRALKRSVLFQIVSIQTIVFCRNLLTRTRDLWKAIYVKLCGSWHHFTTHPQKENLRRREVQLPAHLRDPHMTADAKDNCVRLLSTSNPFVSPLRTFEPFLTIFLEVCWQISPNRSKKCPESCIDTSSHIPISSVVV